MQIALSWRRAAGCGLLALSLAGCGPARSDTDNAFAAGPQADPADPAGTSVDPDATAPATDEDGTCGSAEAEVSAALAATVATSVQVIGQCTQVSVGTSLGPAEADVAQALCETAAVAAYAHGVGAVSVDSAGGQELAIGVKGSPCIRSLG